MNASKRADWLRRERAVIFTLDRGMRAELGIRVMSAIAGESAAWQDGVDLPELLNARVARMLA